jgi:VanZ family protein
MFTSNSFLTKALAWLPLLAWMGLIFAFSHQPSGSLPNFGAADLSIKKGGHFIAYLILAILARRALGHSGWALLWTAVYAVSDEFHQTFIPGRQGSGVDVLIDCAGGLTGLLIYHATQAFSPKSERQA